jgi:hypothetical protein
MTHFTTTTHSLNNSTLKTLNDRSKIIFESAPIPSQIAFMRTLRPSRAKEKIVKAKLHMLVYSMA